MTEGPPDTTEGRIFWSLELLALAFLFTAVEQLFAGELWLSLIAAAASGVAILLAFNWTKLGHLRSGLIVGAAIIALVSASLFLHRFEPGLDFRYKNASLDGKKVTLVKPVDPARRQLEMYVFPPNEPSAFAVSGINVQNDGRAALQPDAVYLSFSEPIQKWQSNAGSWELSPDRNADGWTTYRSGFGLGKLDAGHAWPLTDFFGTPIPNQPIQTKLTLVWESKEITAHFTINPPGQ